MSENSPEKDTVEICVNEKNTIGPNAKNSSDLQHDEWNEVSLSQSFRKLGEEEEKQRLQRLWGEAGELQSEPFQVAAGGKIPAAEAPRLNIWKELEKMNLQDKGSNYGRDRGYGPPRFNKPKESNMAGFDSQCDQPGGRIRRELDRGRNGHGSADTDGSNESHMVKGFDSAKSSTPKEGRICKDSPAYRSLQSSLRGSGNGAKQERTHRDSDARSGGYMERDFIEKKKPGRKSFLDRDDHQETDWLASGDQRVKDQRSSHRRDLGNRDEHRQLQGVDGDGNDRWLPDDDDAEFMDDIHRSQSGLASSARNSSGLEPIRMALEDLDYSGHSTKMVMTIMLTAADTYCGDDSDHWLSVVDMVLCYAIQRGGAHMEFACSYFGRIIDRSMFQKAAYIAVMRRIGKLMTPGQWTANDHMEVQNICDLFGRLLICKWSPGWDSCAKECNMIVYGIMNAVQTWIRALNESTTGDSVVRKEIVEISAVCIWHLTTFTGRKLWLKWPEVVDQLYNTLRQVIVSHSCQLDEDVKLKLLDLYIKLNEWPKSSQPKNVLKSDASVQTDKQFEAKLEIEARLEHISNLISFLGATVVLNRAAWSPPATALQPIGPVYIGRQYRPPPLSFPIANQSLFSMPPQASSSSLFTTPNMFDRSFYQPLQQGQNPSNVFGGGIAYLNPVNKR